MDQQIVQFSLITDGGPFVWLLLLILAFGVVFVAERIVFLHRAQINAPMFVEGVCNNLKGGRLMEALTVCENTPGPVARVLKAILLHSGESESRMRIAAEEAAMLELPVLHRRTTSLSTLARVAPLVGLAGTVFALLRAFFLMKMAGHYATADLFSGDVASALTATGLGLIVAIIFYLGHTFIMGRVENISNDIEVSAVALIRFIVYENKKS
ncbi:MAG: MotA/TolQ/ExbB proton channel family protein [Opitutales bacterium]|nr:MotA/TolQ/ExbB proton channel family protein [Opitutales bacterium]